MDWLPISTAPAETMLPVIIAGQYDNGSWYVEEGFRNPLGHWNGRKVNPPSHWMPLPSPPKYLSDAGASKIAKLEG